MTNAEGYEFREPRAAMKAIRTLRDEGAGATKIEVTIIGANDE